MTIRRYLLAAGLAATLPAALLTSTPAGAATGAVGYTYDALGRLSSVTDPTGASATYAYDAVGNLTGITRAAAPAARFKAAAAPEPPTIDEVTEEATPSGHRLTITGDHLTGSARVKVGGLFADVLSAAEQRIVVAVPPDLRTAGAEVAVTTEGGAARKTLPGTPAKDPAKEPTYTPLQAARGVTALAGSVRTPDGKPLRGVEVAVEEHETETGRDGRFLIEGLEKGHFELEIDGSHAKDGDFGSYEHGVDIEEGVTNALPWITWLSPVDVEHAVRIPSKVKKDLVVTTPEIPGLEVRVPAGTRITDEDGRRVRELSITQLPIERLPFPGAPGMPLAWTLQPGLSSVTGAGLSVVYPNITHQPPGTVIDYVNQDGDRAGIGWAVYGHGRVSADGTRIEPDEHTRLHKLYQLGVSYQPRCDGSDDCPEPGENAEDGDPVDLHTGLFVNSHTDLVAPDVQAAALTRTYRQNDNVIRSFGLGQSDDFSWFVAPDNTGAYRVQMPDGASVPFRPGPDGVYTAADTPTDFQGATLTGDGHTNFTVKLKDGTTYTFGGYTASLIARADRFGNTVTYDRAYPSGEVRRVTTPNGRWIALTHGPCGPSSRCVVKAVDNVGRSVAYTYDPNGRLTSVKDPAGKPTLFTWNACDTAITCTQIASITNAGGNVFLRNTFDANGRVSTQKQADGSTFAFEYELDPQGAVTATTATSPRGAKHRVEFNASGYPVTDTQAFGTALEQITTITRDGGTNLPTAVVDPLGRRTTMTYDAAGRLLTSTTAAGTALAQTQTLTYEPVFGRLASVTNALGKKTTYAYDDTAGTETVTDPLGHATRTELSEGRPVRSTDALGNVSTLSYLDGDLVAVGDPLGRVTSFYSDAAGRLLRATDPLGRRTTYAYDVMNQLVRSTNPLGQATSSTYDANGNVLTHTDPLGRITKATYDTSNRVVTATDALNKASSYTYDAAGGLRSVTDRNGIRTLYTYDVLGRGATTGFKAVTTGTTTTYESSLTSTYDKADHLTKLVDSANGTISWAFDAQDRLTSETGAAGAVGYTYDADDQRTGMTAPGQTATSYAYDAAGRLTQIKRGTAQVDLGYDNADRRSSVTLPGNLRQAYTYDAAAQVTGITYTTGTTSQGTLSYTYDAAGQPVTTGGSLARVTLPAVWSGATYNADNQLTKLGTTTLTYDSEGQLTNDGTSAFTWNARGQLTGAGTSVYAYDPAGRRATKKVGATTTGFLYDGSNLMQERSGAAVSADWMTGQSLDDAFVRNAGGNAYPRMTDRLGSTVAVAASGTPVTSYTYEPFGRATVSGTASTNAVQFTGRENDGNGLQYNRSRYYSPTLQRFISEDPAGAVGSGDNLYAYVGNTPTNATDPTGQFLNFLVGCALGALENAAIGWGISHLTGEKYTWGDAGRDAAIGCAGGALGVGLASAATKGLEAYRAAQAARAARAAAEAAEAAATKTNKIYSARVLIRAAEEPGPFHNFPGSFDDVIFSQGERSVTPGFFNKAKPLLSNDSVQYRLPGTVNGRNGTYEIFTRPSTSGRTEVIMHRFFRPGP